MVDTSVPTNDKSITFPYLQYLADFSAFAPEFDYVKAYEIPPSITSIEWLNQHSGTNAMNFVVANDKKIRLFKLRRDFVDDFRNHSYESQKDLVEERASDREYSTLSTFQERFLKSNGQIIFPGTQAHTDFNN